MVPSLLNLAGRHPVACRVAPVLAAFFGVALFRLIHFEPLPADSRLTILGTVPLEEKRTRSVTWSPFTSAGSQFRLSVASETMPVSVTSQVAGFGVPSPILGTRTATDE